MIMIICNKILGNSTYYDRAGAARGRAQDLGQGVAVVEVHGVLLGL